DFYVRPVFTYPNPGGAAVTGGVVYRGTLPANAPLVGYYIATDYYSGNFYKIRPDGSGGWAVYTQNAVRTGVPNFGEAENGEIFAVSQFAGNVSSIAVDVVLPARLTEFTATKISSSVQLNWKTAFEENMSGFEIEYSTSGANFHHAGFVNAFNRASGAEYSFLHTFSNSGHLFYRLKIINIDNSFEYSNVISIEKEITDKNFVRPSFITSGIMNIYLSNSFNMLELVSMKGAILLKQNISGQTGRIDIPVSFIAAGTYIIRLKNNESAIQQKVIIR
ncbi:MAG TPA: T9SS type A sorting domain-containing protein, partial [Chitinophagaceae bacterium]|nr:T9SS type A sorting domain-containing protein [Chitinophagaceae bacterium]